jgi:hypothetical protein
MTTIYKGQSKINVIFPAQGLGCKRRTAKPSGCLSNYVLGTAVTSQCQV